MNARIEALPCWRGLRSIAPLSGGLTNQNFVVEDSTGKYAVRMSEGDIPVHGVFRGNELAATRAAVAVGLAPEIVHAEPGLMVVRFIEGETLTSEKVREPRNLERIAAILQRCHREVGRHLVDASPCFWVFHILRGYHRKLTEADARPPAIPSLPRQIDALEDMVGPVRIEYAHNDLLCGNWIDDGTRLWLIDWEYSGFGSGLFDLGNLITNNALTPDDTARLLRAYYGEAPSPAIRRAVMAMTAAAALRETLWGRVQAVGPSLDIDYTGYAEEHEPRFIRHWLALHQEFPA
jgi:thiamine kinase-like enzyme